MKMLIKTVTNSDKNSVIQLPDFLLKFTKRTFQQKVHSSVAYFKKIDFKKYILKYLITVLFVSWKESILCLARG